MTRHQHGVAAADLHPSTLKINEWLECTRAPSCSDKNATIEWHALKEIESKKRSRKKAQGNERPKGQIETLVRIDC